MGEKMSIKILNMGQWKVLPKFLTAEEVSAKCGISAARLHELAEAEIVPHVRIDNGPPLFLTQPMLEWIKENALYIQDGQRIPINLIAAVSKRPDLSEIPEKLRDVADKLKRYDIGIFPPCVYFLIRAGVVVYVGQTVSLPARIQVHLEDKSFNDVLYLAVPRENLLEVERFFIGTLSPEYNNEAYAKKVKRENEK